MSNRSEHLTDELITQFLRTRAADPELGLLDDIVRMAESTPQDRRWLGLGPILPRRTLLLVAFALLLATLGAVGVGSLVLRRDLPIPPLPTTPDAWTRVLIETPQGIGGVASLAASPHGLLAVIQGGDRPEGGDGPTRLVASTDGMKWTLVPEGQHPSLGDTNGFGLPSVVGTDQGFLLLQSDEVWTSENGLDWRRLASTATDPELGGGPDAAIAGGPGLVGVGGDRAWYSVDGSDWSLAQVPPPPAQFFEREGYPAPTVEMQGVTAARDKLVAWGSANATKDGPGDWTLVAPVLWASRDGLSWANVAGPEGVSGVVAGPGGFVAAGEADSKAAVWLSTDGEVWERIASDAFASRWSEDPNGNLINDEGMPVKQLMLSAAATSAGYVVVGGDGLCLLGSCLSAEAVIWTSVDGHSWSRLPSDDRFRVTARGDTSGAWAIDSVAWESRFVVGGTYDGKPAIWISESERPQPSTAAQPPTTGRLPANGTVAEPPTEAVVFAGRWEAADTDRSHQTMSIVELPDGTYDLTILDDRAQVCSGTPSTMTGVGEVQGASTLVIGQPEYTCDDGSQPRALSGPPLDEQLSNLRFAYDPLRDALFDSLGLEWTQ